MNQQFFLVLVSVLSLHNAKIVTAEKPALSDNEREKLFAQHIAQNSAFAFQLASEQGKPQPELQQIMEAHKLAQHRPIVRPLKTKIVLQYKED